MRRSSEGLIQAVALGYKVDKSGVMFNSSGKVVRGHLCNGYFRFHIRVKGVRMAVMIHRLVAYQKYGDAVFSEGIQVRHKDGSPINNSDENILIGSPSENQMDKAPEIRKRVAMIATSYVRKYNKEAVKSHFKDHGFKATMDHFGISSKGTMSYIINH